jgi:GT2 family glycosyltransferase/ADP-heptose:LPS heptosyltransferase
MRNVVIQWARLGDLLQTRILLQRIHRVFPGGDVILCADARYAEIAHSIPEVTEFWPIELSRLSAMARHAESQAEFLAAMTNLALESTEKPIDAAFVITRSLAAVAFAEMIAPARIIGYRRAGSDILVPDELAVLERSDPGQISSSIHIADLWASLCQKPDHPRWPSSLHWKREARSISSPRIGIFCEAGEAHRTIPGPWLTRFVECLLSDKSALVTLFGKTARAADSEFQLGEDAGRLFDLRGKTELTPLCDILADCSLVIGPDTGGLHLAAALNVPVIGLYFGGARSMYTGPYTQKALTIQGQTWNQDEVYRTVGIVHKLLKDDYDFSAYDAPFHVEQPIMTETGLKYLPAFQQRPLDRPALISLIIPECGATHYTDQLLADLTVQRGIDQAEVLLVTSGESANRMQPEVPGLRFKMIRSPEALSFAQGCNQGAMAAQGEFLLFLNNDTRLVDGMLDRLAQAANAGEVVSPLVVYPDGLTQNAGVVIRNHEIREIGHGRRTYTEHGDIPDAVSAIAMLVSREVFLKLNGFDTSFVNGYEDLDFCLRARHEGLRCRIESGARLIHYRSSSDGRFRHEDANRRLFDERWAAELEKPAPPSRKYAPLLVTPLLLVSSEPMEAAGSVLRWLWPLQDYGLVPNRDYVWFSEADALKDLASFAIAVEEAQAIVAFRPFIHEDVQAIVQRHVERTGIPLCVDSDDVIVGRFPAASARTQSRADYEQAFVSLMTSASIVTASTAPLVDSLSQLGIEATLLPTRPNLRQRRQRTQKMVSGDTVNLGFFGTPSHLVDLGSVLPALEYVLESNPQLRFYWWGCRPGDLARHPQVRQGGPVISDYSDHLFRLHGFPLDCALVPLLDTPANNARSAIKYFEYTLAGIPAVYSAVKPYSAVLTHEHNGLIVDNTTHDWVNALDILVNQPELRNCLSTNASQDLKCRLADSASRRPMQSLIANLLHRHDDLSHDDAMPSEDLCTL